MALGQGEGGLKGGIPGKLVERDVRVEEGCTVVKSGDWVGEGGVGTKLG